MIDFNIPTSRGDAFFVVSTHAGNSARVALPGDGTSTIRTDLTRNDRGTGKSVSYDLNISVQ